LAINRIIRRAKQSFHMDLPRLPKHRHDLAALGKAAPPLPELRGERRIFLLEVFLRRPFHPASDFFSFIHF
jgi:hypothetical protein